MQAPDRRSVLVAGATGMLGRPVTRALVAAGFDVRALVRNVRRARALLPAPVHPIEGDLRDDASIDAAMDGVEAVYVSLNTPFHRGAAWDADHQGTRALVAAARRNGRPRILRLSALGVPDGADDWWVIRRKQEADDAVMSADLGATVFRCDWFMESLPLFTLGPLALVPAVREAALHWLAGADLGRWVVEAIAHDRGRDRIYAGQGPEAATFAEAMGRFVEAWPTGHVRVPVPLGALRAGGVALASTRYLADVIRHTVRWTLGFSGQETWDELGRPETTIEEYVQSVEVTRDYPRKAPF
jgi:uncharacterized protein YbjT (DUF2867 family)